MASHGRMTAHMPNKESSDDTWAFLETGVERIMHRLSEGMDMITYMELYTAVHSFCTAQKPVVTGGYANFSIQNRGGAHLLGEGLYHRLQDYLNKHLTALRISSEQFSGEQLLQYYIKEWKRYTTAATFNNHLFRYLNRHWVKREMDEGKKEVFDIYTLHLVRWKAVMFDATHNNVMDAVLELVEKQRNGDTIEHAQIKALVMSFVALGLDDTDPTKSTLEVYKTFFEDPYVAASQDYYSRESKQFLAENTVIEYMKKAEIRLHEEKERVDLYLLPDISPALNRACEQALIRDHSVMLREEFQVLLDADRQDDLGRMYHLLSRIPEGLDPLRKKFEAHVKRSGLNAIEKMATAESIDPKVYVDTLLAAHLQFKDLVNRAFEGEAEFVRSLDNACREFVNRNKICKSITTKSPELLAKFTDNLLKTTGKISEDDDMEKSQNDVMTIFKYIEDKDVFQNFYRRFLAKRLVNNLGSDDAETSMISKLKDACGFEYTNKLQRMFQDMQTSKDLNSGYKDWLAEKYDADEVKDFVDSSYNILATGVWPLQPPSTKFSPPPILMSTYERFTRFYMGKHHGRKLAWLWHLCKGDIKANYIKGPNKLPYTFQVSSYQMAILLLFNDEETLTYEQIEEVTNLNKETLEPCLNVFLKAKVLNISPVGAKAEKGSSFTLNHGFKSKKMKVNLNITVKSESKQEHEDTHKTIEEDRKLLLQSAIVRVMKSRKTLKHQALVAETINLIKARFTPKVSDIKKCIETLIEKEYLERLEDDSLGYLA